MIGIKLRVWYKHEYSTYFVALYIIIVGHWSAGETRKSDDGDGRRHIWIVTSQLPFNSW
jgi:hypothetical protein